MSKQLNEECDMQENAHDICEAAVDHVLQNVNTVQYIIKSIEEISQQPFARNRIKCISSSPKHTKFVNRNEITNNDMHKKTTSQASYKGKELAHPKSEGMSFDTKQAYAGYMWRRARTDAEKGDIVLIEEHLLPFVNVTKLNKFVKSMHTYNNNNDDDSNSSDNDISEHSKEKNTEIASGEENIASWDNFVKTQHGVLAQTERNIRHELIHAFDDVRGEIDSTNCLHQACSEIRAARLSGDCLAGEEMKKGRFNYWEGAKQCVERRAILAVEANPLCRGFANRAVTTMIRKCYNDYEPFIAPLYTLGSYGTDTFQNSALEQT